VLDYKLRKEIGDAARRIEAARAATAFVDDPNVKALLNRWRTLAGATMRARLALDKAIEARRDAATAKDRAFIEATRRERPDLLMIDEPGCEPIPVLCMVTGLAMFATDRVFGNPETGFAVLKHGLRFAVTI